jgi:hypothetical protein
MSRQCSEAAMQQLRLGSRGRGSLDMAEKVCVASNDSYDVQAFRVSEKKPLLSVLRRSDSSVM